MYIYVSIGIDIRLGRKGRAEGVGFDGGGNSMQKDKNNWGCVFCFCYEDATELDGGRE